MIKYIKRSCGWAVSIITFVFMFVPEDLFKTKVLFQKLSVEKNVIINRFGFFAAILVLSFVVNGLNMLFKRSVKIKGHNYSIVVKYGDLLKQKQSKILIPFDECFTTTVGSAPADINPRSICGQYLLAHPEINIQQMIADSSLKPKGKSKYAGKARFESGRILLNEEYLLMAFTKLDKDGLGRMSRDEYLESLSVLWEELDKYYGQQDVCIPILGSGVTRIGDTSYTQQELLDDIINSYKLSLHKIKNPNKLCIVCKKNGDFSLNKISED